MGNSDRSRHQQQVERREDQRCKQNSLANNDIEEDSKSYIISNESVGNIFTRMDHDREMIVGFWNKGMFDHASCNIRMLF